MIERDILKNIVAKSRLESVLIWGPRQVGKTTILSTLPHLKSMAFLDDLSLRERAENDPALFLDGFECPLLVDESKYAPNLFSEIKLRIDATRRENLKKKVSPSKEPLYYLTGSNKTDLDKKVKESLAGRCHLYSMSPLSIAEIVRYNPKASLKNILFRGGLPELHTRNDLSVNNYLNDYIVSFLEKDITRSEGIRNSSQFQIFLKLLATRVGQFLNKSEISNSSGITVPTVSSWLEGLERNHIIYLIPGYSSNLSKRIVKMPKLYFFDTGVACRIQGFQSEELLWNAPNAGGLFENLGVLEILKTKENYLKDWNLFTWRTKEQAEIDILIEDPQGKRLFVEFKMAIQNTKSFSLDSEALKVFPKPHHKILVTAGGKESELGDNTKQIPIQSLKEYLLNFFG
jgi:uncharacterized protein